MRAGLDFQNRVVAMVWGRELRGNVYSSFVLGGGLQSVEEKIARHGEGGKDEAAR